MKLLKVLMLGAAVIGLMMGTAMAETKITMTGSTTVLPIAQKAAEVYMSKNKEVAISVAGSGSGDGVKAIIDGTADIGNSSRDMKDSEKKMAADKGAKVVAHVIAFDCVVPVVHPSNPVKNLTTEQLKAIYSGKVKNWKEVGGESKSLVVVSRDSSSGTFEVWNEKILGGERVRPDAQMQASSGAVSQAIAGNKFAIGYVGIGYLNEGLKPVMIDGVTASAETAKNKQFKVARELFMFTRGEPTGEVKKFLDWLKGPEGQKIVVEEKFVPVN